MKKFMLVSVMALAVFAPLAAEGRFDIGAIIPRGFGFTAGGDTETSLGIEGLDNWPFIPIPEAGLYWQGDFGIVKLGLGVRAFSLILVTFAWPNAFVELDLGPFAVEAQVGGGAFVAFGVVPTTFETGSVFFPDLSAWLKLGKTGSFRLGGGGIGVYLPEVAGDSMAFLLYLGVKGALVF